MTKIKSIGLLILGLFWIQQASAQPALSFPLPAEGISLQSYVQWQGAEESSVFDPIGFSGGFSMPESAILIPPMEQVWQRLVINNTIDKIAKEH